MQTVYILVLFTFSCAFALDIFIDGPLHLLDCRSPIKDGDLRVISTAKTDVSEEPIEHSTRTDASEEPVDPEEFYYAARNGDLSFINAAISRMSTNGLDLNWQKTDLYGYTALHIATQEDHLSIVAALLDAGADPDVKDDSGNTALHMAIKEDHPSIVAALLDAGSNPNVEGFNGTPVHMAIQEGQNDMLEQLLAAGADPNEVNWLGESPLMMASVKGRMKAVRLLLKAGANVDYVSTRHWGTALHRAAMHNQASIARLLLQNGADKNKVDDADETPADWARGSGHYYVAELIENY